MEDEDIQDMAYRIAEMLNENGIDARRAEPNLWTLLSNVPSIEEKRWDFNTRPLYLTSLNRYLRT